MAADEPTTADVTAASAVRVGTSPEVMALVLVWAKEEPQRLGEVILVSRARVIGRGEARADDPVPRAELVQQRPGTILPAGAIASAGVSRVHVHVEPRAGGVTLRQLGRRPLRVRGVAVERAELALGETFEIEGQMLFLVSRRAAAWAGEPGASRFGAADTHGIVGESAAVYAMRAAAAFAARVPAHVLVHGPSGSGKELVARAIHAASARAARAMVTRNAATLPEGLIDAELFGNVRNYPHAGLPERPGLIGEADGTTLFLDEIGELPAALQAHLLRLLDRGGEYQRLGDARPRRADLRLIAATNRDPAELKHDLAARLTLRVAVPGLDARPEDVPLIAQDLLATLAAEDAALLARFRIAGEPPRFRIAAELVEALVRHPWRTHVRELERILWQAVAESPGDVIGLGPETRAALASPAEDDDPADDLPADSLRAALDAAGGSVTRAARALGLRNRFQLYRLMKKHGLD